MHRSRGLGRGGHEGAGEEAVGRGCGARGRRARERLGGKRRETEKWGKGVREGSGGGEEAGGGVKSQCQFPVGQKIEFRIRQIIPKWASVHISPTYQL